jgi:zinc transporter, ZIP family
MAAGVTKRQLTGVVAEAWKPSPRFLNWALHAAAGIVIAIVSVELIPSSLPVLGGWWFAAAFGAGGAGYIALQAITTALS